MGARRLTTATLVALCALAAALACSCVPAQAENTHEYLSHITEVPASSGAAITGGLSNVSALTVDSSKDLWVAENIEAAGTSRVDEFDSSGAFVSQLNETGGVTGLDHGIAVGRETGEVYVGAEKEGEHVVAVFSSAGALLGTWSGVDTTSGSFGYMYDLAVDNSASLTDEAKGDLYVPDYSDDVVDVFKPEVGGGEVHVTEIPGLAPVEAEEERHVTAVAVDQANGDVLVGEDLHDGSTGAETAVVDVYEPLVAHGYKLLLQLTGTPGIAFGQVSGLAVDGGSGDIYVTQGEKVAGLPQPQVDQFSEAGSYIGTLTLADLPGGENSRGIGGVVFDPLASRLYVGVKTPENNFTEGAVDVFGPTVVIPDVSTGAYSSLEPQIVTLEGSVNPDGAGPANCEFEWGTSESFGNVVPCTRSGIEGSSAVAVQAQLGGLEPDTTYYYRLQATNANGTNPGEASEDHQFTTPGPGLDGAWVTKVSSTAATFDASIYPHGVATYYYFQYGTDGAYQKEVPVLTEAAPDGRSLGAGEGETHVGLPVTELEPSTSYDYRLVVVSEVRPGHLQAFYEPQRTFTTQGLAAAAGLPDGRQWEIVSSPDKHGAEIQPITEEGVVQAAADGSSITYVAKGPTEAEPEGNANGVQVFSQRTSEGWVSKDIATPHGVATATVYGLGSEYPLFAEDLSQGLNEPHGAFTSYVGQETSPQATERTLYLRANFACTDTPQDCYTPLVTAANVPEGVKFGGSAHELTGVEALGATPNLSHVVFRSSTPLTSRSGDEGGLYEWSGGHLSLVSIRPPGEGGPAGLNVWLGDHQTGAIENVIRRNAISSDGSRVIWTAREGEQHLYIRDSQTEKSGRLDVIQPGASGAGTSEPIFQAASSDGSRVFFTDPQALTKGAKGNDLYMCEVEEVAGGLECNLTNLTPGSSGDVLGAIPGIGEDGTYVYFVATSAATGGSDNLYMAHEEGGVWTTTLIAALSSSDDPDWAGQGLKGLAGLTARVSSNGRYLAFMSDESLTGYDNRDAVNGAADEEVYLYDATAKRLVCASCNPTGARPVGVETDPDGQERLAEGYEVWPRGRWLAANVPGWTPLASTIADYQSRYLSNSGRLFFNSSDALVPWDANGTEDVYEYEPAGMGGCTESTRGYEVDANACLGLISSGVGANEAAFLDASETGGDVFFLTRSKLTSQDFDESYDVYDAHECTASSPCSLEFAASVPPCSSEASCKAPITPQPEIFGPAGSATFSGAGNTTPTLSATKTKTKSLTRAQKLAAALKTCKKKRPKQKRAACEKRARKAYGPVRKAKQPAAKRRAK